MLQSKSHKWVGALLIGLTILPFQNCGKGITPLAEEPLASQCIAKLRADAGTQQKLNDLQCDQATEYVCERRIFSPDLESSESTAVDCTSGVCVVTETRIFNTAAARGSASEEEFQPGGEYNREEDLCSHRASDRGVALFVGQGESVSVALAKAQSACRGETL